MFWKTSCLSFTKSLSSHSVTHTSFLFLSLSKLTHFQSRFMSNINQIPTWKSLNTNKIWNSKYRKIIAYKKCPPITFPIFLNLQKIPRFPSKFHIFLSWKITNFHRTKAWAFFLHLLPPLLEPHSSIQIYDEWGKNGVEGTRGRLFNGGEKGGGGGRVVCKFREEKGASVHLYPLLWETRIVKKISNWQFWDRRGWKLIKKSNTLD